VVGDVLRGFERALVRQVRGDAVCSERLRELAPQLSWEPQIRMGVSVESQDYLHRIDDLRQTTGRLLDGRTWDEMPCGLDAMFRIRFQFWRQGRDEETSLVEPETRLRGCLVKSGWFDTSSWQRL
jgi:hypothetical protein